MRFLRTDAHFLYPFYGILWRIEVYESYLKSYLRKKPMVLQARQFFSSTVTMGDLIRNLVDSNVLFYKTAQGEARIEVIFNGDTFWMMNV